MIQLNILFNPMFNEQPSFMNFRMMDVCFRNKEDVAIIIDCGNLSLKLVFSFCFVQTFRSWKGTKDAFLRRELLKKKKEEERKQEEERAKQREKNKYSKTVFEKW